MRYTLVLTFVLVFGTNAFAVAPQFWRTAAAEDFLAGEIEGFAVTSRGQLKAAPAIRKMASFTDPFVLSQATAPNGDLFFGTGNDGKIYRLRGSDLTVIHTAAEPEVYALAFRDGALYAGTSPNGKIYRIDPNGGAAAAFFDPGQAYIWALHVVGDDLIAATGVEGKLFRIAPGGQGTVLFDSPETHLRSMAVRRDGSLLVGGSSKGRIYVIGRDGSSHALYDSALNEISAIHVDAGGTAWAAGVSNMLPSSAPAQQPSRTTTQQRSSSGAQSEQKKEETTANVEVTFSFEETTPSASISQTGTGELYRINADGFVEVVRKFEREMIYGISGGGGDGRILLSTGPQGRIYEYSNGEVALIATVPDKQVVSIAASRGATVITTTNSGAVYRIESARANGSEFRSAAKDVERFSRFGHYRVDGSGVGNGAVAIAFRTGNTRTPDGTWSSWSAPSTSSEGNVSAPPGRYLQWKLTMPRPSSDVTVDSVTVAYVNRNVAPVIENITVQDPAVVFISSGYPASTQVVEATNPDEYGIFSSLEPARERNDPGKRAFRKGYRTIVWRARDDNGDSLRYSVFFRMNGTDRWLRLRENMQETQINFDTSQLPDGTYEIRLTVTDAADNPDMPLSSSKEGVEFRVDNTAPRIAARMERDAVIVTVTDAMSPVGKVEYAIDAQNWVRLTPEDGIADSTSETYRIPRSAVAGKFLVVRAVDAFYNVATESVTVP
ncbi:MAG TPA: WD40 repeat domain-containing protein [Thermoanaerobaculia bacterium]|nr:WD40 repeat domain-containing protein [Thermoanaerobaculia bacterium]